MRSFSGFAAVAWLGFALSSMYAFGCGGERTVSSSNGSRGSGGSGGSGGATTTSMSTGGENTTSSETMTTSTATSGDPVYLRIAYQGSLQDQVKLCQQFYSTFRFKLSTGDHKMSIKTQRISINATDGGSVVGAQGLAYFTQFGIAYEANSLMLLGPVMEGNPPPPYPSAQKAVVVEGGQIDMVENEDLVLTITAASTCVEAPIDAGMYIGHHFSFHWLPMLMADAFDVTDGVDLDSKYIEGNEEIVGDEFLVTE